jgi:hypothetical protein
MHAPICKLIACHVTVYPHRIRRRGGIEWPRFIRDIDRIQCIGVIDVMPFNGNVKFRKRKCSDL